MQPNNNNARVELVIFICTERHSAPTTNARQHACPNAAYMHYGQAPHKHHAQIRLCASY